jgi:hypothetical protein
VSNRHGGAGGDGDLDEVGGAVALVVVGDLHSFGAEQACGEVRELAVTVGRGAAALAD